MPAATVQSTFQDMATSGTGDAGAVALGLTREVTAVGLRALAAKLLHVAISSPDKLVDVYDNAAAGWTGAAIFPPRGRLAPVLEPPDAFWTAFWALMDWPESRRTPGEFTAAMARLAGLLPPEINDRAAATALSFDGVYRAASRGPGPPIAMDTLTAHRAGSLGATAHRNWVAQGRPPELLPVGALGLEALPFPLGYLNREALMRRRFWATVAGYSSSPLGEVALSAFQMGQFGHPYSALLVGFTATEIAFRRPIGLEFILDAMLQGWRHGRQTPPLLGVDWRGILDLPLGAVRDQLEVTPFESPLATALRRGQSGSPRLQ